MSTQWLVNSAANGTRNRSVSVIPASDEVVRSFSTNPLNLITIWGAARTGKSFFMNALARKQGLFQVVGSMEPCTEGVDLSRTTCSVSELVEGSVAPSSSAGSWSSSSEPLVGFADVEGQGDKSLAYEVQLATPLLLISKVVIFNWLGRPNRSTMLDKLAVMCDAARKVARDSRQGAFGHLVILLRDVYSGEEEVEEIVLLEEDPDEALNDDDAEKEAKARRNKSRKLLRKGFKSIKIWCLPTPHAEANEKDRKLHLHEVKAEFSSKINGLRHHLKRLLREPHSFGGSEVRGGLVLNDLLREICHAMTTQEILYPMSMMESVRVQHAQGALSRSRQAFKSRVQRMSESGSLSETKTAMFLQQQKELTHAEFLRDVQDLGGDFKDIEGQLLEDMSLLAECVQSQSETKRLTLRMRVNHLVHVAEDEVANEIQKIVVPIEEAGELETAWSTEVNATFVRLLDKIKEVLPAQSLEEFQSVPTLRQFKAAVRGQKTSFQSRNYIHLEIKRGKIAGAEAKKRLEQHEQKMKAEAEIREEKWKDQFEKQREEIDRAAQEAKKAREAAKAWGVPFLTEVTALAAVLIPLVVVMLL